jgi:hypothetical protein
MSIGLWLRTAPQVAENKLFPIANGEKVLIVQSGDWSNVFIGGVQGYVRSKYLGDCR